MSGLVAATLPPDEEREREGGRYIHVAGVEVEGRRATVIVPNGAKPAEKRIATP